MKAIIVEDEKNIRDGIVQSLSWEKEGFLQPETFESAIEALQFLEKEEVDLIITDIYMPVISGLEFIKLAKELKPDTEVLILTGHNCFELAQEAIALGVRRYLLKPVSAEQLLKAIRQIRNDIIEKMQLKDWISIATDKLNKYLPVITNQFWNDLIHGERTGIEDILSRAEEEKIKVDYNHLVCLAVSFPKGEKLSLTIRLAARQIMERLLQEELIYLLETEGVQLALLSQNIKEEQAVLLQKSLDGNLSLKTSIGISLTKTNISMLQNACSEALEAARTGLAIGGSIIMRYGDIISWKEKRKEYPYDLENKILDMLRFRDSLDTDIVMHFFRYVMPPDNAVEDAKMMLLQLLAAVCRLCNEYGLNFYDEYKKMEKGIEQFENICEMFLVMLDKVLSDKNRSRQRYVEIMLEKTKSIMHQEFPDSGLNVKLLANRLGVTPNYLSRVFSENIHTTCIEYLTAIRMEAAKEMLTHTGKKSYVIGLEVGYPNANYFSALFKKYAGVSPKEFRKDIL